MYKQNKKLFKLPWTYSLVKISSAVVAGNLLPGFFHRIWGPHSTGKEGTTDVLWQSPAARTAGPAVYCHCCCSSKEKVAACEDGATEVDDNGNIIPLIKENSTVITLYESPKLIYAWFLQTCQCLWEVFRQGNQTPHWASTSKVPPSTGQLGPEDWH